MAGVVEQVPLEKEFRSPSINLIFTISSDISSHRETDDSHKVTMPNITPSHQHRPMYTLYLHQSTFSSHMYFSVFDSAHSSLLLLQLDQPSHQRSARSTSLSDIKRKLLSGISKLLSTLMGVSGDKLLSSCWRRQLLLLLPEKVSYQFINVHDAILVLLVRKTLFTDHDVASLQGHEKSTEPKLHLLVGIYVV